MCSHILVIAWKVGCTFVCRTNNIILSNQNLIIRFLNYVKSLASIVDYHRLLFIVFDIQCIMLYSFSLTDILSHKSKTNVSNHSM